MYNHYDISEYILILVRRGAPSPFQSSYAFFSLQVPCEHFHECIGFFSNDSTCSLFIAHVHWLVGLFLPCLNRVIIQKASLLVWGPKAQLGPGSGLAMGDNSFFI